MDWLNVLISLIFGALIGAVVCAALWRKRLSKLDLQLLNLTEALDRLEEENHQLKEHYQYCQEHHGDVETTAQKLLRAEAEVQTLRQRLRIAKTDIDLEHARNAAAEARIRALEAVLGQRPPESENEAPEMETP